MTPTTKPKKKKKKSPTQRALADFRKLGYLAEVVEKVLPIPGRFLKRDLFKCIDIVAMKAGQPLVAIQATDRTSVNKRMTKSRERATIWAQTGNRFQVRGYGGKSGCRVVEIDDDGTWHEIHDGDFAEVDAA